MGVKSEKGTAANHYLSSYYHHTRLLGLDADQLLAKCDLQIKDIDQPERRIDSGKLAAFLVSICDELQDESAGHSDSKIPRGSFFMMAQLAIHEHTLKDALLQMARFYSLVTDAVSFDISCSDDTAELSVHLSKPELDKNRLLAEITLMAAHRFSSWLIAENIPLKDIYFSYPEPGHIAEYSYTFPGTHHFLADKLGFTFPKHYLDRECVQNRNSLKGFIAECPKILFLKPQTDFSLSGEITRLFSRKFDTQLPTLEDVAERLHMTKRTLSRKLKEEGTSYQNIKDTVRKDRAIFYLTRHNISISRVAEKLGFSDPAVFARAFQNWTGLSPMEYRKKHRVQNNDNGASL